MAQTKVTTALLREFSHTLKSEKERFNQIKSSMDTQLEAFFWHDPIAIRFKTQYAEGLELVEKKLIPAMEKYYLHLDKTAGTIDGYTENDSSNVNWGTFAVAGGAAAFAGTVGAGMYRGKNYSSVFAGVDLSYKNWGHKTPNQKIAELQKLENNSAKIQGRESDTISGESDNTWGTWDDYKEGRRITLGTHSGNEIKINQSLLEGDNTYEKLKVSVNTIAHEGQHDNQEEKNLFPNNTGVNYISEGDDKPICIMEYYNGQIDRKATILKFQQAAIDNPQAQVHDSWRTLGPDITNAQNIRHNYGVVRDTISNSNSPLSANCDYDDYAWGNEKEINSRKFGDYIEEQFKQYFPERPQRIMSNSMNNKSRPINIDGLPIVG